MSLWLELTLVGMGLQLIFFAGFIFGARYGSKKAFEQATADLKEIKKLIRK